MIKTIFLLVLGIFILFEVSYRLLEWKYSSDFTYRICRPFGIPFSMKTGVIISIVEIGLGVVLLGVVLTKFTI